MVWLNSKRKASLYRLVEWPGVTDMAMIERWLPGSFVLGRGREAVHEVTGLLLMIIAQRMRLRINW